MNRTSGCGCNVAVDAGVIPMPVDAAIAISQSSMFVRSAPIRGLGGSGQRSRVVVPVTETTINVSLTRSDNEDLRCTCQRMVHRHRGHTWLVADHNRAERTIRDRAANQCDIDLTGGQSAYPLVAATRAQLPIRELVLPRSHDRGGVGCTAPVVPESNRWHRRADRRHGVVHLSNGRTRGCGEGRSGLGQRQVICGAIDELHGQAAFELGERS